MNNRSLAVAAVGICILSPACAISKPCSQGGDTSWPTDFHGDKRCYQRALPDGRIVNHGQYYQYYPSGQIAVEGRFIDGLRDGIWVQYDESGKRRLEKYYDRGVEKTLPTEHSKP